MLYINVIVGGYYCKIRFVNNGKDYIKMQFEILKLFLEYWKY